MGVLSESLQAELTQAARSVRASHRWSDEPIWLVRATSALDARSGADLRAVRRAIQLVLVARAMGVEPERIEITRRCAACGDPEHGPAVAATAHRVGRLASSSVGDAFAFSLGDAPLGLDLARIGSLTAQDVATARDTTRGSWSLIESIGLGPDATWTALEALAKTTGLGLAAPVELIERARAHHDLRWFVVTDELLLAVATPAGAVMRPFASIDFAHGVQVAGWSAEPIAVRLAGT